MIPCPPSSMICDITYATAAPAQTYPPPMEIAGPIAGFPISVAIMFPAPHGMVPIIPTSAAAFLMRDMSGGPGGGPGRGGGLIQSKIPLTALIPHGIMPDSPSWPDGSTELDGLCRQ